MSLPKDILELRGKRKNLEDERRSLTDEKTKKRERLRALEQMMIVELSNGNEKTRQEVAQLNSSIDDLENRLEQIRQEAENQNNNDNNDELNQANVQINAVLVERMEKEVSTDTASERSVPSSENRKGMTSQGSEKKKRELS
jgi:FtsZ-binding cell division protein ZapB